MWPVSIVKDCCFMKHKTKQQLIKVHPFTP